MTNTEYRQFIIELEFIGKDKNYSGIFNKILKSFSFKSIDKLLKDKKKAYDFQVSKLFDMYRLEDENLFDEFDKIWEKCLNRIDNKFNYLALLSFTAIPSKKLMDLDLLFISYINETYKYCSDYAKEKVPNE